MTNHNAPTDPAPPLGLIDIAALIEDLKDTVKQSAADQGLLFERVFTRLGELESGISELTPLIDKYTQVIGRLGTMGQSLERIEYQLHKHIGETASVLSNTVSIKDFLELKTRIETLEKRIGAGNELDEATGQQTNREVGSGR